MIRTYLILLTLFVALLVATRNAPSVNAEPIKPNIQSNYTVGETVFESKSKKTCTFYHSQYAQVKVVCR